jgi:hypothetical protein
MILLMASGTSVASANSTAGFAITDLTQVKVARLTLSGHVFAAKAEPKRLTYVCQDCSDLTAIDVLIDTSTDGTEGRLRSGETKIETLAQNCRARESNCQIDGLNVQGATGWVSKTVAAGNPVSTTVLFKNGDRLVIRSIAPDLAVAYRNGQSVVTEIGTTIIGK